MFLTSECMTSSRFEQVRDDAVLTTRTLLLENLAEISCSPPLGSGIIGENNEWVNFYLANFITISSSSLRMSTIDGGLLVEQHQL